MPFLILIVSLGALWLSSRTLNRQHRLFGWASITFVVVLAGVVGLVLYWLELQFVIHDEVSNKACSSLVGIPFTNSPVPITVEFSSFPPSVSCGVGGRVDVLTPSGVTRQWATIGVLSLAAVIGGGLGAVLIGSMSRPAVASNSRRPDHRRHEGGRIRALLPMSRSSGPRAQERLPGSVAGSDPLTVNTDLDNQ